MYEGDVLNLAPETFDKTELCFGATVFLTLIVDFTGDFLLEYLGGLRVLEDLILAEGEEFFKAVLRDGKPNDELLPREEGSVQEPSQALFVQC